MSPPVPPAPSRPARPRFYVAVVLVAAGAAAFAMSFRAAVSAVFRHGYGADNVLEAFAALPYAYRIAITTAGGALAGLASRRGRGNVGDVMEAVTGATIRLPLRATSWKALGSWFAIVSGGSIGREGPLIQFGGALGGRVGAFLGISDPRRRALIAAGTAAGFAAAYNTPIAAVLFVVEVVMGVVALHVVLPAIVASALATAVTRLALGPGPLYGQHTFELRSQIELACHAVLGVVAGAVAVTFMKLLGRAEQAFRGLPLPRVLVPAVGGALVGACSCGWPAVTGNGYEAIEQILRGAYAPALLGTLLIAKPLATAASVGSGSPGGVFTPSLMIGALLGGLLGHLFAFLPLPTAPAGAYALVGMAAVVGGTTHAPLMAAVLVFEISGDYAIVLPLLIATSLATATARRLDPRSIYGQERAAHGLRQPTVATGTDPAA